MKPIPFLTEEEIQKLQEAEAHSSKEQKKTAEQIEAIYTSGQNILVSASAGSGKTFVMAERILNQLTRGVEISQLFISTFTVKAATELKERLEKKISQQIQESDDVDLKQHLGRQLADLPNAAIGTMDSFTQKFLGKHGYLLDIAPNFRILQNQSEQLLLKNEVFHEVFEAHYQGKQKETFSHLLKNFAGRGKDERGLRQQVYKIYDFLQSTSNPQKWLSDSFLKGFEEADFTSEKGKLTEQIQQALWDLESFFRYHLDNDAKEFPKAAYLENVQLILDEIGSLNQESNSQAYQAVLARVVAISKEKNGRSLTNASRKADLKPLADSYNEERKTQFAKLGQLSDQITILDYQERYHEDTWELAKTFQSFMSDFVEAYRERKHQENAFEFADISHYTIEILEKFPKSVRLIRSASMKSWSMSIRIPTIFKNGCWIYCLMITIALWWEISSNLSIVSVKQTRRFSMKSSNAMRKIQKRASSFSSRKISVVVQKCYQQPMMSLNVSWTKRSVKSTMTACTSLFLPIAN